MPEISGLFGIVIRMFVEASTPHLHAYDQKDVGVLAVDIVEMIGGAPPARRRKERS